MTVIARRVASTPARTATQTWEKIVGLIAPDAASAARQELAKAKGIACASISAEVIKDAPIIVWGSGPRLRIYCAFGEDALTGDGVNEDAVVSVPTDGNWRMSIPCTPEDAAWCKKKLAGVSQRISARSIDDDIEDEPQARSASSGDALSIDVGEFMKS